MPKDSSPSKAYQLISRLEFNSDSIRVGNIMGDLLLRGNVKLDIDGTTIKGKIVSVSSGSEIITTHLGSIADKDGSTLIADEIEYNLKTKLAKVTKGKGYYRFN